MLQTICPRSSARQFYLGSELAVRGAESREMLFSRENAVAAGVNNAENTNLYRESLKKYFGEANIPWA
jgi:hypothetical protein